MFFSALSGSLLALAAQKFSGCKTLHTPSIYAYGLFGLFFVGPIPYYFNELIIKNIRSGQMKFILRFLAERALLAPIMIALFLYFMPIFEVNKIIYFNFYDKLTGNRIYNFDLQLFWPEYFFSSNFKQHSPEEAMNIFGRLFMKMLQTNAYVLSLPIFLNNYLKAPVLNIIVDAIIKVGWV